MIVVVRVAGLVTVQDGGWSGRRSIGLPPGGAMDPAGLAIGNALVGNPGGAAALEIVQGELSLTFTKPATVAVMGGATVRVDGVAAATDTSVAVARGSRLDIAATATGRFIVVAVSGGIAVPLMLGSRSTYLPTKLGGFNGRRLVAGDRLRCGPRPGQAPPVGTTAPRPGSDAGPIRLAPGPQGYLFGDAAFAALGETSYRVAGQSDRMGTRLEGRSIAARVTATLPSEATCLGAIQVPDDGQPIVILRDGPTVGGYPKIGAVIGADLTRFAQVGPGQAVRFAWVTLGQARLAGQQSAARLTELLASLQSPASR